MIFILRESRLLNSCDSVFFTVKVELAIMCDLIGQEIYSPYKVNLFSENTDEYHSWNEPVWDQEFLKKMKNECGSYDPKVYKKWSGDDCKTDTDLEVARKSLGESQDKVKKFRQDIKGKDKEIEKLSANLKRSVPVSTFMSF